MVTMRLSHDGMGRMRRETSPQYVRKGGSVQQTDATR